MKLTIITVNRNNANGLKKTIESVLNQDFNDFEYIVIDGGSSDKSVEIIYNYSEKFSYWCSEHDSGIYNAMNKGILKAKGEYLLFLNSGDFLTSDNVLADIIKIGLTKDIVRCACKITKNGEVVYTVHAKEPFTFKTLYFQGIPHQSTFIKRDLFEKYGLYREDFAYNSDIEFWYRTLIFGTATTESIDIALANYNLEGISTGNVSEKFVSEQKEILSNPLLSRFLPDYNEWKSQQIDISFIHWIKQCNWLYKFNIFIFKVHKNINKIFACGHKK